MGDQNVNNFGDGNVSNQYNGDVTLMSLDLPGLAGEDALARKVVGAERTRRAKLAGILGLAAVGAAAIGYVFFLNRGDLTFADVFNNLAGSLSVPLAGMIVSAVITLGTGAAAIEVIRHPSRAETSSLERIPDIEEVVLSKGYTRKQWRAARSRE